MSTAAALSPAEVLALPAMPSVKQAFAALNIGASAGYQLIQNGEFPMEVLRLGRHFRVRRADLLAVVGLADPAADEDEHAASDAA
ncbi:hypothetical protein [Streptomyces sp. NPDC004685]